jgi:hypothetical protein
MSLLVKNLYLVNLDMVNGPQLVGVVKRAISIQVLFPLEVITA